MILEQFSNKIGLKRFNEESIAISKIIRKITKASLILKTKKIFV